MCKVVRTILPMNDNYIVALDLGPELEYDKDRKSVQKGGIGMYEDAPIAENTTAERQQKPE